MNASLQIVRSSGDLMKSVAKFSWAMSLFLARQATAMVVPPASRAATSLDTVADATRKQLSGPVKTAFAVGTNVQAGLVDAAFNLAGFAPRGQVAPSGETSGLAVPLVAGSTRRVTGVRTVASGAPNRPVPQAELVERLTKYQVEASTPPVDLQRSVAGLWKSEGLSTTVGKYLLPENRLSDPQLLRGVLPIAHVGFGSGSTESVVFDVDELNARFAERCAPDYREFSYEGIGAIMRIYERGFFKVMSGALGLIHLDAPDGPNPTDFFAEFMMQFPPEIQRLITHGYGRIIAFSNMNIYKALEETTTFPRERIEPAAHGCGFAFAFMNSSDLPHLLDQSAIPFESDVRAAFQNGLIYGLVFFDWYVGGLLDNWRPKGKLETEMIEHARAEAALTKARGYPLAFRLQNPRR